MVRRCARYRSNIEVVQARLLVATLVVKSMQGERARLDSVRMPLVRSAFLSLSPRFYPLSAFPGIELYHNPKSGDCVQN